MNYYIADTHFGHENILRLDERPFASLEEMQEAMIERWNSTVKEEDTTFIVGDFAISEVREELYARLNGRKFLVIGNHDNTNFSKELRRKGRIVGAAEYKEVKDGEDKVILCHYPILFYGGSHRENVWHLCGHTHARTKEAEQFTSFIAAMRQDITSLNKAHIVNVGCMFPYMNYTPRTLEELKEYWRNCYV